MIFAARTLLTLNQLEAQVDAVEHHASWAVPATAEAVGDALQSEQPFTPVARAAMLLWGRIAFGSSWFDTACKSHGC